MSFIFENLEVYKRANQFVVRIYDTCSIIRHKNIVDQLSRAALSIPLNIAEGNGRFHYKEKIYFFRNARGSLLETIAILNILKEIDDHNLEKYESLYLLAEEIAKMLSGLIKYAERGK